MRLSAGLLSFLLMLISCSSMESRQGNAAPEEILSYKYRIEYREFGTPFLYDSLKPAVVRDFGRLLPLAESGDARSATLYFETEGHTAPAGGRIPLDPPDTFVTDYRMSVTLQDPDGKVLWESHTAGWAKTRVENGPAPTTLTASVRHLAGDLTRDLGLENRRPDP